eukprot:TRINITY_DN3122_c0_g1_i3.p1 TRINITY_DN3122_c0_g1~~TRINITY_DN3122_c0_g1_i3.p1  ORF type:complete len:183 (-),score=42.57 TRINITY_DN3122_c0_g1_i3:81-629(-)
MKIYKDIFTGDEMLSDTFKVTEVFGGTIYEVETKMVTKSNSANYDIGANASEEEADEGVDDGQSYSVNNLVDAHQLSETAAYPEKKNPNNPNAILYTQYIRAYLKKLVEHLKESGKDEREIGAFQANAQAFVKEVMGKYGEFSWYTGSSMDPEAMLPMKFYKEGNPNPFFYFWKDGLKEEKY